VIDVLRAPNARDDMGRAARARVLAHFRREPAVDRYEALYRKVMSR
jgi:hypothetical protein